LDIAYSQRRSEEAFLNLGQAMGGFLQALIIINDLAKRSVIFQGEFDSTSVMLWQLNSDRKGIKALDHT
jgi:hypothetical protein